jgi:hypothetical protein
MKDDAEGRFGAGHQHASARRNSTGSERPDDRLLREPRKPALGLSTGRLSRRQFGKALGIEAGILASAGLALNTLSAAVAHAAPLAPPGSDPSELLDGASTFVRKQFQGPASPLGDMDSKVTAIRFHTNTVVGVNRDNSPRYTPSYEPGGLVGEPVGIDKNINGVEFIEYTGEMSGYVNRSSVASTEIVYGPIDEFGVDHTAEPVATHVRGGLKGICFILKIPRHGWNGVLVDFHTGDWPSPGGIYNNELDEIYLVSQGYAHVSSFASGFESKTDTNHSNDEYWESVVKKTRALTCRIAATRMPKEPPATPESAVFSTNMYTRDFAAVMKNLCRYATGAPVSHTYFMPRGASGNAALTLATGRRSSDMRYYGNNYTPAFANCPRFPNGDSNPDFQPDAPMVFDGFLVYSPLSSQTRADLDPRVPISPAPMIVVTGESDAFGGHFGGLVLPYYAHRAKALAGDMAGAWPDTNRTFFYYSFEHLPHFPQLPSVFALAKNGSGRYVCLDASGNPSLNTDGQGRELDVNWARALETCEDLGVELDLLDVVTRAGYSHASLGGIMHRMLDTLHRYVTTGAQPPASNIDPYFFTVDPATQAYYKRYPKFPAFTGAPTPRPRADVTDTKTTVLTYGATKVFDVSVDENGVYRAAMNYIDARGQDVLRFTKRTWRTPEDAARLGLYTSWGPFFEYIDRPFTEAELLGGFSALDWDGRPLVTMTLPNGKTLPESGYKNHGAYVSAVAHAVRTLVNERLYDAHLGALHVAAAAQAEYPLIVGQNPGDGMRERGAIIE